MLAAASICDCDGGGALGAGTGDGVGTGTGGGVDAGRGAASVGTGVGLLDGADDALDDNEEVPTLDWGAGVSLPGGVGVRALATGAGTLGGVDGASAAVAGGGVGADTVLRPLATLGAAARVGTTDGVGVGVVPVGGTGVGRVGAGVGVADDAVAAGRPLLPAVPTPALGIALGAGLDVGVRPRLGSWTLGVVRGLRLGVGPLGELGVVAATAWPAGLSAVEELGLPPARAAMAARSAVATSAVICARACASCASGVGESRLVGSGEPLGLGVTTAGYGPSVGVGVTAGPVAAEGEEEVSPAVG